FLCCVSLMLQLIRRPCRSPCIVAFSGSRLLPRSTLFPYTTLFRSLVVAASGNDGFQFQHRLPQVVVDDDVVELLPVGDVANRIPDRKSTRLNSSHVKISYAVFCLKKKKSTNTILQLTDPIHHHERQ